MDPNAISVLAASAAAAASFDGGVPMDLNEYSPPDNSPNGRLVPNGHPAIRGKRNKLCGCGSGLKFKKCCLKKPGAFN